MNGLVNGVNGPSKLACDSSGACALEMAGLPVSQLDATCRAGECLVQTSSTLLTATGVFARGQLQHQLSRERCTHGA